MVTTKPPLTLEKCEEMARQIRRAIGMDEVKILDGMTLILKFKECSWINNYKRVPDKEMPETEATWNEIERIIYLKESVIAGINKGNPRDRMTLSEELMHCALGHKGVRNRSTVPRAYEKSVPRIRRDESEAKRMAAVFLCPEYLVHPEFDEETLMREFGISRQAAYYRSEEIKRLRRRRTGQKRPLPQSVIDFLQEAKRK